MRLRKTLPLIKNDTWLKPYAEAILGRHNEVLRKEEELVGKGGKLRDFANAHHYFGLHPLADGGWVLREWAPNATAIHVVGNFNGWRKHPAYEMTRISESGNWEVYLSDEQMRHGDIYKLLIEWDGGQGERIPAYATRVVQDTATTIFSAQVWKPENPYQFKVKKFVPRKSPLLIYECHIGMSQQREAVGTFEEFRVNVLPRVIAGGYNAIQIMAIQEHPYYGSFGYHVSNFYAASSRFGTPDELKRLIDTAHQNGIAVIMDLVHSHAVKNENEGLGLFDGTPHQYFYPDGRRLHSAWDSLCFDYGKNEVIHFLLSNCKFWLEEYHFDGFRFDGVTSMLYLNHGLGQAFSGYADYYDGNEDTNAITYLTLANKLIHQVNPNAITIAEEMSGMPGLASTFRDGGIGFDYRMAMGIPDYWIKTIKERKDEYWQPSSILWELTNRRSDERTISYAESHDQALVGDKTLIFRLIDSDMYWHMQDGDTSPVVARGLALHKMIRMVTASTINGGYLNFMGNEFGHPEWIDFPREGNDWSYKYARRQWDLVDRNDLKYKYLNRFDSALMHLLDNIDNLCDLPVTRLWDKDDDQVLAYTRGEYLFVYNFNPTKSFADYKILTPVGEYHWVLDTDQADFGGFGNIDNTTVHFTADDRLYRKHGLGWLQLYIPARSAMVLRLQNNQKKSKTKKAAK